MKIAIFSDLHIECNQVWMPPEGLGHDVLILAGDIDNGTRGVERFAAWSKPVIYVAGNHEFYGHELPELQQQLSSERWPNMHVLENSAVVLGGVRFLGTTLWTDFELFGPRQRVRAINEAQQYMNDFRLIDLRRSGSDRACLTARRTISYFERSLAWLEQHLDEPFDGPTVVVTHHLPSLDSVAGRYRNDLLSAAFASDLSGLIKRSQPAIWAHGHTHCACDYLIGKTRVVCNPKGYPGEADTGFRPDKVIEF